MAAAQPDAASSTHAGRGGLIMGDRTYVWFAVPAHVQPTADQCAAIARTFRLSLSALEEVLRQPPDPDEAGFANQAKLRLVQGCPCLVWEDDQSNHGGAEEETLLQEARIPYLRRNLAGCQYGPTRTAFDGRKEPITIRCDAEGEPIVAVEIRQSRLSIHRAEYADIRRYVRLRDRLLTDPRRDRPRTTG